MARSEANENSDLDLLVAWEPARSLLDHAGTEKSLHWYVRDRIPREATPL